MEESSRAWWSGKQSASREWGCASPRDGSAETHQAVLWGQHWLLSTVMLSRLTRAAYSRDKEKDRMLQHAWSPDRRAPWQHAGISHSSIYSHVQLLALMCSLYHEVGRISAPLSHQAAALSSALSILMSWESNMALQNALWDERNSRGGFLQDLGRFIFCGKWPVTPSLQCVNVCWKI